MNSNLPFSDLHVLVVEDDAIQAFEMVSQLNKLKAVPLGPAPSIEQALRLINKCQRIDIVLLDVMLRGEVSFPVADELIRRGIPLAFVTGNPDQVSSYPTVPVHVKPAEISKVLMSLQAMIGKQAQIISSKTGLQ